MLGGAYDRFADMTAAVRSAALATMERADLFGFLTVTGRATEQLLHAAGHD